MSKKEYASSVKLGLEELMALSRIYVNKHDQLYKNAKKIPSVEGFEDFVGHSYEKTTSFTRQPIMWIQNIRHLNLRKCSEMIRNIMVEIFVCYRAAQEQGKIVLPSR